MSLCGTCSESGGRKKPVVWCPECDDWLCQACEDYHRLSKASKHHHTIPIEKYCELPKIISDLKLSCEVHGFGFTHYCKQHEIAICSKCLLPDHKDCSDITPIDQAFNNIKASVALERLEKSLQQSIERVANAAKAVSDNQKGFTESSINIQKALSQKHVEILKYFDKLKKQTNSCVLAITKSHESTFKSLQYEMLEKQLDLLKLKESISKMKKHGNELQVLLGINEIGKQLNYHIKYITNLYASLDGVSLDLQFHNSVINLENSIPEIGKIHILTKRPSTELTWDDTKEAQVPIVPRKTIRTVWAASYDYNTSDDDKLSFKKGDVLVKIQDHLSDEELWLCTRLDFQRDISHEGYVPSNYLTRVDDLYQHRWYVGEMSNEEQMTIFQLEVNADGSFLVSKNNDDSYVLRVKTDDSDFVHANHYPIEKTGTGKNTCFSSTTDSGKKILASSLEKMIEEFKDNCSEDLDEKLTKPCLRIIDDWKIKRKSLVLKAELPGVGMFASHYTNYEGNWNKSIPVRIQVFATDVKSSAHFETERKFLARCYHENIIKLYGVCSDHSPYYIITELAPLGTLNDYLVKSVRPFQELLKFAVQVSNALTYLERKHVIHNNLKSCHIWLFKNGIAKLGDFSFALEEGMVLAKKELDYDAKTASPEIWENAAVSIKSDVWAYGIFLIELTLGDGLLYEGLDDELVKIKLTEGYRHPKPKRCPKHFYDIAFSCWNFDPEKRPTFGYLNSFLDDYNVSIEDHYAEIDKSNT